MPLRSPSSLSQTTVKGQVAAAAYLASSRGKQFPGISVTQLTSHLSMHIKVHARLATHAPPVLRLSSDARARTTTSRCCLLCHLTSSAAAFSLRGHAHEQGPTHARAVYLRSCPLSPLATPRHPWPPLAPSQDFFAHVIEQYARLHPGNELTELVPVRARAHAHAGAAPCRIHAPRQCLVSLSRSLLDSPCFSLARHSPLPHSVCRLEPRAR